MAMLSKRLMNGSLLGAMAASAALLALPGCELIVDFDRTKIDGGSVGSVSDATTPDATSGDGGGDADASTPAPDAKGEASADAGSDATDAPADSPSTDGPMPDVGPDVGPEAGPDGAMADGAVDGSKPDGPTGRWKRRLTERRKRRPMGRWVTDRPTMGRPTRQKRHPRRRRVTEQAWMRRQAFKTPTQAATTAARVTA